jgi:alpha/beta superfamily hydrolase
MLDPKTFTTTEHIIRGPAGDLELVEMCKPEGSLPVVAIVCHPNPPDGGTMNNKVVTTVAKTFSLLNVHSVIRFNFRGVGRSQGEHDFSVGEVDDFFAVIAWAREQYPQHDLWLAGFSFGGYIASRAADQPDVKLLLSIAPAVDRRDYSTIEKMSCSWVVAQGENDDVVAAEDVYAWIEKSSKTPVLLTFPNAGNFFHRKLIDLRERLLVAIKQVMSL